MTADPEELPRAQAMALRVLRTAEVTGTPASALPLLGAAHTLAMEPRHRLRLDDHDPDFLHPGRCALILMLDTGEVRAEVLAAAMLTETGRADLRVDPRRVAEALAGRSGAQVARLVAEVPLPDAEDLTERLVVSDEEVQLIALAERLDHVRHAHLWPDLALRRAAHALACDVYAPVAVRVHARLAGRYARWCEAFARKQLR